MIRKLVYVFNPISGTTRKDKLLKKIESATKAQGLHFELLPANAKGDYTGLRKKIARENITDVIIIGGDGTVNQITGSLRGCPVKFGIIPAGSGNGLAYAANIPKNIDQALEVIFQRNSRKTDAFLINDHYACMLSGVGFDAVIAHKFAMQPNRGLATYIRQSLKHFLKAPAYDFEITFNGSSFFTEAYFISIANSNQFGNNVTIAPKAKLDDGLLDIVIVQKMNKAKLPLTVWKQISGNNPLQYFTDTVSKKTVLYFQTAALTIKNLTNAPLHIDGDPYQAAGEFKIEILKDCFELLQP
ncbi:MAG TPA: YegS/Rv2252/BmrU family lipid kinase [Chitinophagaceae bacterium]